MDKNSTFEKVVMLTRIEKRNTSYDLIFMEVGTGHMFRWVTRATTQEARNLITTGIGNYHIPIRFKVTGRDVNQMTLISHVRVQREKMK